MRCGGRRSEEFLDLKKFIRHLAIENFLAEEDGLTGDYGPNNFYFYRFLNTNRFTFLPWDKSNTFWESPSYSIFRNIEDGAEIKRNRLVVRALKDPELRELWLNTLLSAPTRSCSRRRRRPRRRRVDDAVAAVGSDAHLESDPARDLRRSVARGLHQRGLRRVDPVPDDLGETRSEIVRAQVAADERARRGVRYSSSAGRGGAASTAVLLEHAPPRPWSAADHDRS